MKWRFAIASVLLVLIVWGAACSTPALQPPGEFAGDAAALSVASPADRLISPAPAGYTFVREEPVRGAPAAQVSSRQAVEDLSPTPLPATRAPGPTVAPPQALFPTRAPPPEHAIPNMRGHRQVLAIDCEAAAAQDWARYFGVDFSEREFQSRLPRSDNPDYGFVGSVNTPWGKLPPEGYGVHAGPVADLLNVYGVPARAYKGYTLGLLKARVAEDMPVIAWVVGRVDRGAAVRYVDSEGRSVVVAAYEHVIIVTGYTETHIRYLSEGVVYQAPVQAFLASWGVLGNMVVVDR